MFVTKNMGEFSNKNINLEANVDFAFKPLKFSLVPQEITCQCMDVNNTCCRNVLPNPRYMHRIVCDSVNMYFLGGIEDTRSSSEVWKYNITTCLWTKLIADEDIKATYVVKLRDQLLIVYGNKMGNLSNNNAYICEIHNDSNQIKFCLINGSECHPPLDYGSAIVLGNQYLYTIGGSNPEGRGRPNWDIYRQNIRNGVREPIYTSCGLPNEPTGYVRCQVAFEGNRIYVFGRIRTNGSVDFQVIFAFNLSTNEWEQISSRPDDNAREGYPEPRVFPSCAQYNGYAYLSGGINRSDEVIKDIWRLDPSSFEWMKFKELVLPERLFFHSSSITSNGKLIAFGGRLPIEGTCTRASERKASAVYTAWLCIPSLKEICWEALTFYCPNLRTLSKEELLSVGVPYEYIFKLDLPNCTRQGGQVP